MGEKVVALSPDHSDGTWVHQNGALTVRVVDGGTGLLQVPWVEEKREDLTLQTYLLHLPESGSWMFWNLQVTGDATRHLWGRPKKDDQQVVVWLPTVSKLKALVQAGALPGRVSDGGDVVLDALTAEHMKLLTSEAKGVLLDWEDPLVLIRVAS